MEFYLKKKYIYLQKKNIYIYIYILIYMTDNVVEHETRVTELLITVFLPFLTKKYIYIYIYLFFFNIYFFL